MSFRLAGRLAIDSLLLIAGLCCPWHADGWETVVSGGGANLGDAVSAVGVGPSGEVIVVGRLASSPDATDFVVVKLRGTDGGEVWRHVVSGPHQSTDQAFGLAIDPTGDVVAVGQIPGDPPYSSFSSFVVVKLSSGKGEELWRKSVGVGAGGAVTLDSVGNIFAAGRVDEDFGGFVISKRVDATGVEFNRKSLGAGTPRAIVSDPTSPNVIVVGDSNRRFAMFRVSASAPDLRYGALVFDLQQPLDPATPGGAYGVAVDHDGNAFAVGYTTSAITGSDFTVARMEAEDPNIYWRRDINGTAATETPPDDRAFGLAIDSMGNPIAAGSISDAGQPSFAVVKLAGSDGSDAWKTLVANGEASAIAVDPDDQAVAAGTIDEAGAAQFAVVRVGTDGGVVWQRELNQGSASALVIDGGASVVGGTVIRDGAALFRVLKLTSGGEDYQATATVTSHAH